MAATRSKVTTNNSVVAAWVSPAEYAALALAAESDGITRSMFIRRAVRAAAAERITRSVEQPQERTPEVAA